MTAHWAQVLVVMACAFFLSACTSVHIQTGPDAVRVVRHFGWLSIEPAANASTLVGEVSGVGIVQTPMGWAAGYTRQRWSQLPEACTVVVWIGDEIQADAAAEIASRVKGACVVAPKRGNEASGEGQSAPFFPMGQIGAEYGENQ